MKSILLALLILVLFFVVQTPAVLAKLRIPTQGTLQPMPADVTPDITHNINSNVAREQIQEGTSYNFGQQINNSESVFLPKLPIAKNNTAMIIILFVLVTTVIIFLVFLYFKK